MNWIVLLIAAALAYWISSLVRESRRLSQNQKILKNYQDCQ
jgi:hypothetical protein